MTPYRVISWPVSLMATKFEVEELKALAPDSKVLDVGIGTGITATHLQRDLHVQVDGVDASRTMLEVARRVMPANSRLFHGSAVHLPFEAGTYNVVVFNYVLRYMPASAAELALREAARVTKQGGKILIADLSLPRLRPGNQQVDDSVDKNVLGVWAEYTRTELVTFMQGLGFKHKGTRFPLFSFLLVFQKE